MAACFEKVPVAVGEVWYVPGGLPHALGEGLTVLEVMEPSDFVVRCEFEREGIVVPPEARFMGQAPEDALRIFDYSSWPVDTLQQTLRVQPETIRGGPGWREDLLIGPWQIDCFEVRLLSFSRSFAFAKEPRFMLGIVESGNLLLESDRESLHLRKGDKFWVPAAICALAINPLYAQPANILICYPGK